LFDHFARKGLSRFDFLSFFIYFLKPAQIRKCVPPTHLRQSCHDVPSSLVTMSLHQENRNPFSATTTILSFFLVGGRPSLRLSRSTPRYSMSHRAKNIAGHGSLCVCVYECVSISLNVLLFASAKRQPRHHRNIDRCAFHGVIIEVEPLGFTPYIATS
jgi:hypothetical protein